MEVKVNNRTVRLEDSDFLAAGGQAKVYAKGDTVYKIYHDPKLLVSQKKMQELAANASNSAVALPKDQITDAVGCRIGLTFDFLKNTEPIFNMGSNGYWQDKNLTAEKAVALIEAAKKSIQAVHDKNCLIVDLNPFNLLVDQKTLLKHWLIDTESWQTKSFPATAIMPGIRDFSSKAFSRLTDWYSFAIITCEFFIGVHPFKGGAHPRFGPKDMELRMQNNASVFDKNVRLNARIRALDTIPENYRKWYFQLFQEGKRIPPPEAGVLQGVRVVQKVLQQAVAFEVELLQEYQANVTRHRFIDGKRVVWAGRKIWIDQVEYPSADEVIFCENEPVFLKLNESGQAEIKSKFQVVGAEVFAEKLCISDNTLFVKSGSAITQVEFTKLGKMLSVSLGQSWNVLPLATKVFDGVCYQDALGEPYLIVPGVAFIRTAELKGFKILNARKQHNIILVLAHKSGQNTVFIFVLDKTFGSYTCYTELTDEKDLNTTILKKQVAVSIPDDGKLKLQSLQDGREKILTDKAIDSDFTLGSEDNTVVFFINQRLFKLTMK